MRHDVEACSAARIRSMSSVVTAVTACTLIPSSPTRPTGRLRREALGEPVTVTYDQVQDPQQVEHWLVARLGTQHRRTIPGAHGGRCIFSDGANRPARITGMYEQFPYVVSVYAASPQAAIRAWRKIVRQRPPEMVRGVRSA